MKLNHNDLNVDHQKGKKPGTIVFIHGNSSSMQVFDDFFNQPGFEYGRLRLDLPGHGDSFRSDDPGSYAFANYRDEILRAIGHIDEEIILFGNSMGGHLAIEIAPEVEPLAALVISGTPPVKKPVNAEEAFLPFPYIQYMFTEEVPQKIAQEMFPLAVANQTVVNQLIEDFYKADPKIRSAMGADIAANNIPDEVTIFQNLKTSKYILDPLQDPTPNMDYIRSMARDAAFIEIPDCGHYPSIEQPALFYDIMVQISKEAFSS